MVYSVIRESMNLLSLNTFESSLQALPVAMVFSKHLLLTQESPVAVNAGSTDATAELLPVHTVRLTPIPRDFGGYSHGGINELIRLSKTSEGKFLNEGFCGAPR